MSERFVSVVSAKITLYKYSSFPFLYCEVLFWYVCTRHDPSWKPEPPAPIDYCYVRPHHIPAVNALCREYFWPGIDSQLQLL